MKKEGLILSLFLMVSLASAERPNVLFILIDDMGWKDPGYMGSDFFETPHIDKLASEGMVFTDAYSAAANCAPARASLLSGQYTPRHKIYNVGLAPRGRTEHRRLEHIAGTDILDRKIKTWANTAQEAGYRTATIGKWHLSHDPIPYGFDINIAGTHSGAPPNGYYPPHPNVPGLEKTHKNEYLTDRLSAEAIQFIKRNKDHPWLLYLSHFAVHTPLHAKKELIPKYTKKKSGELHSNVRMATMIQSVDDGIGEIIRVLDTLGLTRNTIVVFYSDNGGYGPATDMEPLKGYKGTYYEGGIRVPFFVKWPTVVGPGQKTNALMIGVDIFPTLCEMMGLKILKNQIIDGESLVPILRGCKQKERVIFWHFPAYLQSYKAVVDEQRDPLFRSRPCSVVRKGDWKLLHYYEDDALELYNLRVDIGETTNLATKEKSKSKELLNLLNDWLTETEADIPVNPNPDFDLLVHNMNFQEYKK